MKKTRVSKEIDEHERNVNLSIKWCRRILTIIAVWPQPPDFTLSQKCFYRFRNVMIFSFLSYLSVPCIVYMIVEVQDVYNKIKVFGPTSFCVMALIKYYVLIVHESDIRRCITLIELSWKDITHPEDREIMIKNARYGSQLIALCTFIMYSGLTFYYVSIPIGSGRIEDPEENVTYIPLMFPFPKLIVDTRFSPTNEIIFSFQMMSDATLHGVSSASCSLASMLAAHICGQMEIMVNWMKHLVDGRSDLPKSVDGRIGCIVEHHIRILEFLELTEKTLRYISLVEFLGCTMELCLLSYYVLMEWSTNDRISSATYAVLLVSLAFNIFIYCYIGEVVAEGCRQIAEISYMIEWYRLLGKRKLSMIFIMQMSNSTIKLTAGNIVILSYSKFGDVVKSAFAFLNVLRTVT
ncbi:odorant receptor 4-like [Megachile rotundata]|uniref:odorant receptor 4-like n=1 Tax=Megachile rotundata TaxID=143995 RepID=UPI003FD2923D